MTADEPDAETLAPMAGTPRRRHAARMAAAYPGPDLTPEERRQRRLRADYRLLLARPVVVSRTRVVAYGDLTVADLDERIAYLQAEGAGPEAIAATVALRDNLAAREQRGDG